MTCPNCRGPLVPGEAFFKKAAHDLVAFGAGSTDLHMRSETGEDLFLLSSSEKTAAQFCRECGVVVIATEKGRRSAVRRVEPS